MAKQKQELLSEDGNDDLATVPAKFFGDRKPRHASLCGAPVARLTSVKSVFIFNRQRQLLLQLRSPQKITFPGLWTNTCCSHPLNTETEVDGVVGVKTAAIRKLQHELGIPTNTFLPDDLRFLTRIQYRVQADDEWAEHEIDYNLIVKSDSEVPLDQVNQNEVMDTRYVDEDELRTTHCGQAHLYSLVHADHGKGLVVQLVESFGGARFRG